MAVPSVFNAENAEVAELRNKLCDLRELCVKISYGTRTILPNALLSIT